jgi:hypothetical protein
VKIFKPPSSIVRDVRRLAPPPPKEEESADEDEEEESDDEEVNGQWDAHIFYSN